MKTPIILSLALLTLLIALVLLANWYTQRQTAPYLYHNAAQIPAHKAALLLGTSPTLADGRTNLYFTLRIQAAAELYRAGKVRYIIVSGDNRKHGNNEPEAMKAALIAQGIPAECIIPDYAGIRTLDSVLRARNIFGQSSYIIVSQAFHNERAVYIARAHGIAAIGYNAPNVKIYAGGFKTRVRELGARVKMYLDLLFNKQPKHSGDAINLPD